MRITVLCGGDSPERQVSLRSGENVCEALRRAGNEVVCLDVLTGRTAPFDGTDKNPPPSLPIHESVVPICKGSDAVFLALHGGIGENGQLQAFLDCHGISYTGASFLPSAICMDKGVSRALLSASGVPIPSGYVLKKGQNLPKFSFPCCVKPVSSGSSVGVSFPTDEAELEGAISDAFDVCERIIIEEKLVGRELTVGIVCGKTLPIVEIIPKTDFYSYESKYNPDLVTELCPAPLTETEAELVRETALSAASALLVDSYCRVDIMLCRGTPYCLEINTLPGMTGTSLLPLAADVGGISLSELCMMLVKSCVK